MTQQPLSPVVKKVSVALSQEDAFDRFTREIHLWWPLGDRFSVGKEGSDTVSFGAGEGGDIVEHFKDGDKTVWGTVLVWQPPSVVRFTWHPGSERSANLIVQVNFSQVTGGTEVELTHTGWENLGERGAAIRGGYEGGWDVVLGRYTEV